MSTRVQLSEAAGSTILLFAGVVGLLDTLNRVFSVHMIVVLLRVTKRGKKRGTTSL